MTERKPFGAMITAVFNDMVEIEGFKGALLKGEKVKVSRSNDFAEDPLSQQAGVRCYVEGVMYGEGKTAIFKHITKIM